MPDLTRPTTYIGKLQFAQRLVKSAQYRNDAKLAVRELCEAIDELITALLDREEEQNKGGAGAGQGAPG